ncbi:hypothetical protein [Enterovibrio coralii]|uniref:Uncharacterized protein n=1 Tax=Enterovibrio coralii TaxID=294935 RepID=A0A135I579_9GAMM|nr:hypothetical protein [Enterovibrio coralii]KXF80554.1 hypothetical protein ATN88_07680 [Enterovibrio coralii]
MRVNDFNTDSKVFQFKHDEYALSKIRNARVKKLKLMDNLIYIVFCLLLWSGGIWLAIVQFDVREGWVISLALALTAIGGFSIFKTAKYALQLEVEHSDETGLQWVTVVKTSNVGDLAILDKQVLAVKSAIS